ncbi:NAD(P)H-nitrite reductase [Aminobacter sp. J44]|nr:NAD(P)H-nitrite reductase [Aminobacter sp. J44]
MDTSKGIVQPSLAARAFRAGKFRLGASFRFGRARGAFCHSGWCQQCKVALKDGSVGLACQISADDLAQLRPDPRWKGAVSYAARFMRPWFHEKVILRPAALQQWFLGFIRHASRALPLSAPTGRASSHGTIICDVLVVGAGIAGTAALEALQERGVDAVIVDESELTFLDHRHKFGNTTVLGIYRRGNNGEYFALCAKPTGTLEVLFNRLVLATGTYDRLLPFPGNDIPGIIGLHAFRKLSMRGLLAKNKTYAIYTSEATAHEAKEIASAAGVRFLYAAGSSNLPDDLADNCLKGVQITRATGRSRLQKLWFSNGRRARCDVLVVGYQQPRYELQLQSGQQLTWRGSGSAIEPAGEANFPVLVVGAAAGVTENIAEVTRSDVLAWLLDGRTPRRYAFEPLPGCENMDDQTIICPCEDVTVGDIRQALRDGFGGIEHLKRRTGAATGPCQGKLCHCLLLQCLAEGGYPPALPTMRPLIRPTSLASFAGGIENDK